MEISQKGLQDLLASNPAVFAQLYPDLAKQILGQSVAKSVNYAGYPGQANPLYKHDGVDALSNQMGSYINEDGFFVDCALLEGDGSSRVPVINTTIFPVTSLLNILPVVPSFVRDYKVSFITDIGDGIVGVEPDGPCDDPPNIVDTFDACKIQYPYGRWNRETETGEIDTLIEQACGGIYDNFFFVGEAGFSAERGLSDIPGDMTMADSDYITAAAVRRQMSLLGRHFQKELMKAIWTGDPANNTGGGGYREFYGILELIRDDYGTTLDLMLETAGGNQATCDQLNSCVLDFENTCICTGDRSLYEEMQEAEAEIYDRADIMGLLPMTGVIVMPHVLWSEFVKCLPCEIIANGCQTPGVNGIMPVINLDVVNEDLRARNEFMRRRQITLNSRTYDVFLDSSMPITETAPAMAGDPWTYDASIVFIPLTIAGGIRATYIEHKDYRRISSILAPVSDRAMNHLGWTDAGRFHTVIEVTRRCFQVNVKTEPRLIFKAPHLAWRIDNVRACTAKRRTSARVNP